MKLPALACGLLAGLWPLPSPSGESLPGNGGLQNQEILTARSVSQAVFAAQRAERREAEDAGLVSLAEDLRRLRVSAHRLRALEMLTPLLRGEDGRASSEPNSDDRRLQARDIQAAELRTACSRVVAKTEVLRSHLAVLRARRQQALVRSVLQRLDALAPTLTETARAEALGAAELDVLASAVGPLDDALQAARLVSPAPTFATRTSHRREIPRVP